MSIDYLYPRVIKHGNANSPCVDDCPIKSMVDTELFISILDVGRGLKDDLLMGISHVGSLNCHESEDALNVKTSVIHIIYTSYPYIYICMYIYIKRLRAN